MKSGDDLMEYLKKFKNLNTDKNKNKYSAGKAPHKAILLLSVILLYKNSKIDLTDIKVNNNLKKIWSELWDCLEYKKTGPIYLPMYHLKTDGFWNINFKDEIKPTQPSSIKGLEKMVDRVYLEEDLINLLNQEKKANKLLISILEGGYFSENEKRNLYTKLKELGQQYKTSNKKNFEEDNMNKKYNLSPKKDIYEVTAQDIDPYAAIKEFVDNAIDNWNRLSGKDRELNIEIRYENGKFTVRDNSGGLGEEEIPMLFTLGMTSEDDIEGSIGAFGIGAKKAIVRLGDKAILKSRYKTSEKGYGFRVDDKWLEEDDWDVDKKEFSDMRAGVTEIIIEDLKINWTKDFEKGLKDELGKTYDLILRKHKNLTISVNGDKIKSPEPVDWSFTRFDDLFPRRFKNIVLNNKEISKPVFLDITVGLLRIGDYQNSGADFYCQNRKVIENVKDERAGFYAKNKGGLGIFHTNHDNRLKVIIELKTEHDASNLPWNSQKSEIKFHHPVTKELHHWMKEIVGPYFDLKTGDIRENAVKPFDRNSKFAANGGEILEYDYKNVKDEARLEDLPSKELKEIKSVIREAKKNFLDYHLNFDIDTSEIKEWQERLYKRELELLDKNFNAKRIDQRAKKDLYEYIRDGKKNKSGLDTHEFDYYKYKLEEYEKKVNYEDKVKDKAKKHLEEYIEEGETQPVGLNDIERIVYEKELERLKEEYEKGNIQMNIQSIKSEGDKTKIDIEIGGDIRPSKDIPVPIPRDKLEDICEHLDLPPDSSPEEIGKKLANEVIKKIV